MAFGLGETARLAVRIDLEGNLSKGISGLTGQVRKLDSSVSRVGRGAGQIGAGFARAGLLVGGAAVTGLGAAAKAAIDFEDAFAGVRKTVDEADLKAAGLSFEDLEQSFRGMAKEIPIAATEFARLGEIAGALGVGAADIDEFVKTTALLGVTTNLSADEAADAFGRIGTILNLTGDDYKELADSIVALGNAGASTESEITEITKRFAAEAKAAGLLKEEMVGLASVTASLGFAPERGGTALARVFANMGTNIALANKKGKAFSKLVGEPIADLQKKLDRGEGLSIFLDVLDEIKGLSPTEANRTLKALGITNASDRNIFRTMSQNLDEVNRQLEVSKTATGALGEEAQKRFDTVASKIAVFKNNLVDAAITIGEGMIPAIGRATEKLTKFLQEPGNVKELKSLGAEIGEAIDGINWDEVIKGGRDLVGVLKSSLMWAKRIFDVFNALPAEIKGATVGLLALNKLSGGLIAGGVGNILGGVLGPVLRNLGASLPGVGKAFVQPVFVTNMPMGGMGGTAPVGGAAAGAGKMARLGNAVRILGAVSIAGASIAALAQTFMDVNTQSSQHAEGVAETLNQSLARNPTLNEMLIAQRATRDGIRAIQSNPLHTLVQGSALDTLRSMDSKLTQEIIKTQGTQNAVRNAQSIASREAAATQQRIDTVNRTTIAMQALNAILATGHAAAQSVRDGAQTSATRTAGTTAASASRSAGATVAGATHSSASRIVAAIWAARPVIQSTTVVNSYTTAQRSGATQGSRRSGPLV